MKVLDLRCGAGHAFEGWFGSEGDYGSQRERGLVDCPVCGNADVVRLPSAPRLNLSRARAPEREDAPPRKEIAAAPVRSDDSMVAHGHAANRFVEAVAELLRNTEDVGDRFAEEARRMHYGESDAKAIRGRTTPQEREALADEGIDVITLPTGLPPKSSLQ